MRSIVTKIYLDNLKEEILKTTFLKFKSLDKNFSFEKRILAMDPWEPTSPTWFFYRTDTSANIGPILKHFIIFSEKPELGFPN